MCRAVVFDIQNVPGGRLCIGDDAGIFERIAIEKLAAEGIGEIGFSVRHHEITFGFFVAYKVESAFFMADCHCIVCESFADVVGIGYGSHDICNLAGKVYAGGDARLDVELHAAFVATP